MIRATTGGVLKSYRTNLMNSFITVNKARETMLTQRTFNSYAEDPASAAKAFRLRKSRMTVHSQYNICNDTYSKYQSAWSCLDTISKLIDTDTGESLKTLKGTTLKMLNDPTGDAREQLNKALDQMSENIVQNLNQKYGDNFIFAGADGHNVPFTVETDADGVKQLLYRGVPVDASVPPVFDADGAGTRVTLNANGEVDPAGAQILLSTGLKTISKADYDQAAADYAADPTRTPPPELLSDAAGAPALFTDKDGNDYYIEADGVKSMTQKEIDDATADAEKLDYLMNEKLFVDIGLGFQESPDGKLIETSAFNAALNGIRFIGHGLDEDGDPKNIFSIVQKLSGIAARVKNGQNWTNDDYDEFFGLVGKLEDASSEFKTEYTNMDASTTKLGSNLKLLQDNFDNLQQQYSDLEDVEPADAITSFIWAQYCYNAALKVGNSVLSESLMDYMN